MFPIRCNKCFKNPDGQVPFQLNRCYHIICISCKSKFSDANKCPICKQPTKGIAITPNVPSSVANYFKDPMDFLKMYKSISKFQSEQNTLYYKHFYEEQKIIEAKKQKLQGYIKLDAQLREQIEREKKRIGELRNYNAFHEQKNVSNISSNSSGISKKRRPKNRPRTPAFSDSEQSDNDAETSHCFRELKEMVDKMSDSKKSNLVPSTKGQRQRIASRDGKDFGLRF